MDPQFRNPKFHIEGSISLFSSVFNRQEADESSRNIVRQLELQHLAWHYENSLKIVRAQCPGDQRPSVIRAFFVLLHLSETGLSVPELMAEMAAQCFHFSEAFVKEMVDTNNHQLREGGVPAVWAVAYVLHRHSLGDSAEWIAQELEHYWFEMSESLVQGIIQVQLDRDLVQSQDS